MSVETPFQLGNDHCLFLQEIDEDTQLAQISLEMLGTKNKKVRVWL